MDIYYHHTQTDLGLALVAFSPVGVCFLQFGKSLTDLRKELQITFPSNPLKAVEKREEPLLEKVERAITAAIAGYDSDAHDIPIALHGTKFQRSVWEYLRSIPSGEVRSYAEVARGLDLPRAARAVARACGANSIALLIPCHRVVRSDGTLGGYRWGIEAKRRLLAAERVTLYQGNSVTGDMPDS